MSATRTTADLAVVVIGLGAPAELIEAVRSVEAQDMAAEIVVVNSGGGDAAKLLSDAGIHVPVRETAERLYVGAARNLGIAMTAAPFVAFLASDCLAAPGWVAERVRLHKTGMRSVASAVLPAAPENRISWAHHLLLFPRRLPGLKASDALRYGASYDRRLFDEIGLFDGSLRTGEDTEFAARLSEPPAWEPRVVTLHRNALRIGDLALLGGGASIGGRGSDRRDGDALDREAAHGVDHLADDRAFPLLRARDGTRKAGDEQQQAGHRPRGTAREVRPHETFTVARGTTTRGRAPAIAGCRGSMGGRIYRPSRAGPRRSCEEDEAIA